jgi:hypothetical protein
MTSDPRLPADPVAFIREKVRAADTFWTYHVNMRLQGRFITRRRILESVDTYEIIESYPADKYLPSYLILAQHGGERFHVLFAVDVAGDNVRIVTAYRPNLDEWQSDLRARRKTP